MKIFKNERYIVIAWTITIYFYPLPQSLWLIFEYHILISIYLINQSTICQTIEIGKISNKESIKKFIIEIKMKNWIKSSECKLHHHHPTYWNFGYTYSKYLNNKGWDRHHRDIENRREEIALESSKALFFLIHQIDLDVLKNPYISKTLCTKMVSH